MSDLKNKCSNCGMPVTNSISVKLKEEKFIKLGKFINNDWICDDCVLETQGIKSDIVPYTEEIEGLNSNNIADSSDVSPNTPPADET
jgi:hypothetical protein